MLSFYTSFNPRDYSIWPWDFWSKLVFILLATGITLYLSYRAALPKPIPGIPHRIDGARHIFGDIPALLKATANSDLTHMQWIQHLLQELDSPVIQIFMGPFSKPVIVVADFCEAQDILMRRKEWDRSDVLRDLFWGLIPDHHSQHKTNSIWKARRRLLQDLMSRAFLHNVAVPALYANASTLISLWEKKTAIASGRPFTATEDIFLVALDAVHAFAFGEGFEYNATKPRLELLEGLDPESIQKLLDHGAPISDDEPVHFPDAKSPDLVDATLSLTDSVETVQGTPSMSLTWKLLQFKPDHRRAKRIRDTHILRELKLAVDHMNDLNGEEKGGFGETTSRIRSAVDHMIRREDQLAEKEGRKPEYFSPTMMTEVSNFKKKKKKKALSHCCL